MDNQSSTYWSSAHSASIRNNASCLRDDQPIPLSPKAFDLLLVLTQRDGQVVVKDDLMKLLWPDTFVEESNLAQHIFQLRKALGERAQDSAYIVTVPGRGYRFAQKVRSIPVTVAIPEKARRKEEDFIVRKPLAVTHGD